MTAHGGPARSGPTWLRRDPVPGPGPGAVLGPAPAPTRVRVMSMCDAPNVGTVDLVHRTYVIDGSPPIRAALVRDTHGSERSMDRAVRNGRVMHTAPGGAAALRWATAPGWAAALGAGADAEAGAGSEAGPIARLTRT